MILQEIFRIASRFPRYTVFHVTVYRGKSISFGTLYLNLPLAMRVNHLARRHRGFSFTTNKVNKIIQYTGVG